MMSPHHTLRLAFRPPHRRVIPFMLLGGFGVALLALLLSFVASAHAASNTRPPGGNFANPVVRAVDVAEPAIVRLATLYEGHVDLMLCGQVVTLPAGGSAYTLGGLGSGAFISANGDILTADHVVHIDKASLDDEIFQSQLSASDIAGAINAHASCLGINYRVTAGDIANGYVQYTGIPYKTSYSDPRRLAWQAAAFTGSVSANGSDSTLKALLAASYQEATLVTSSTFEENDLAVLHVALADTPSIQLDNSADVAAEDQLTIIGFPGNGDVSGNATDLLTASINTVMVSAIKSGPNGAKLIQVGGNVEHGDSGGPALDSGGHIVGVVSFGGLDPRGSTAFLRTSDNARSLITSAGVSTHSGAFQKLWEQAFADYASAAPGHWHKAAQELDALSTRYPSFKGIQEYQKFADNAAQTESVNSTDLTSQLSPLIAVATAVVVVALVVFFVLRRRRARPVVAPAMVGQGLLHSPYGPGPSAPYGAYPGNPYAPPAGYGPYGGYAPPSTYGPGGYGAYGPPSNFRPTIGISNVPAGVAVVPSSVPPEVSSPATAQELASSGPLGRMSLPPSSHANGMPAFDGSAASSTVIGTQAPPSDTTPASPYRTPSSPFMPSSPFWSQARDDAGMTSGASGYSCTNGHGMAPSEIYCSVCGAPRRTDSSSSLYSSYTPRP